MHYIQNNIIKHIKSSVIFKLNSENNHLKNYIIGFSTFLKFTIGRQWCDSLFLLLLTQLFLSLACIRNTFLSTLSLGFCWHCADCWAPVVFLVKSLLIKKCSLVFHSRFFYGSANEQRTDKGTHLALKPPLFKASVVNLGCIQSPPLRWPSPTSPVFFQRDEQLRDIFAYS